MKADLITSKSLDKHVDVAKKDKNLGLSFVPLDTESIRIVIFADAIFASNAYMTSQVGFFLVLVDKNNRANILQN